MVLNSKKAVIKAAVRLPLAARSSPKDASPGSTCF
jgi:hypothetical protein